MKKEKVNIIDFLTNDENPTLKRLEAQLLKDPEFIKLLKDKGYKQK